MGHLQHGVSPGIVPSAPAAGPLPGLADFLTRVLLRGPSAASCHRLCTALFSVVVWLPAAWISSDSELCSPRVAPRLGPPPVVSNLCVCKPCCPHFLPFFSCFSRQEGKCLVLQSGRKWAFTLHLGRRSPWST